ncbi:MAG TPA: SDR family NAD(P)-dependent oxidoreductase [Acidimicrobiales bacterium]|nr:SDR family NAD(P)-dependent oxidoreductase [Acidimicrobiales bacterium]
MEPDLHGRVVLITGATSGIGKEAARWLSARGATVVTEARVTMKGRDRSGPSASHAARRASPMGLATGPCPSRAAT